MVLSNDGGVTFGAPTLVTTVTRYNQPSIRNGVFLPSATTDRATGESYVVYQGLDTALAAADLLYQIDQRRRDLVGADRGHAIIRARVSLTPPSRPRPMGNAYRVVLRPARQRRQHDSSAIFISPSPSTAARPGSRTFA